MLHHPQALGREALGLLARTDRPPCAGGLAGAGRLVRGHELVGLRADQIAAAHLHQRLAQHRPIVGVVIAQEGLVQASALLAFDDVDLLALALDAADPF